jgi:hypothetical protein
MAGPKNDADQTTSGATALAVCIAQTLHERDSKFLEALQANVAEFYRLLSERNDVVGAAALYSFALSLDNRELFPRR